MANKGFFIITDISGYTEYLTLSELDHANEILQSLFDVQLAAIKHPFVVSGFRGDAIFVYVPESNFVQSQSLIESLENLYIVFAKTLEQMQYRATCRCRACSNISLLDLKMCIHYGEYLVQKLADREELLGADVIVPHRMLKNSVLEKTGIHSYALFSQAAAEALDLSRLCESLTAHTETYDHLGEIKMWIQDMHPVWEREKAQRQKAVNPDEAWAKFEDEIPLPPSLVWEYLTDPTLEARSLGLDFAERIDNLGGRVRPQAGFHCTHGDIHFYNTIIDWHPFEYYTFEQSVNGLKYYQTRRFLATASGTLFGAYFSEPAEGATEEVKKQLQALIDEAFKLVKPLVLADVANGKVTLD
jgi:hypothetical protein